MIRLITSYYADKSPARQLELDECFTNNHKNAAFSEMIILMDTYGELKTSRLKPVYIHDRPTFDVFFSYAKDDCWNVVSNSDIYFDESIQKIESLPKNYFLCISRHDVHSDGSAHLLNRADAQDAWAFYGKPNISAPFFQGIPGCDNSLAYLADKAGYVLSNPAKTIKCYHLHNSGIRNYNSNTTKVPQPYKTIWPHE